MFIKCNLLFGLKLETTNILMLQFARVVRKGSQFVISWVGQSEVATTVASNMRVMQ
jgi:hypothetical protein